MKLRALMGSGEKIMLLVVPFLAIGLPMNLLFPEIFSVGGPSTTLKVASIAMLAAGVAVWMWSVVLILTHVPKGELITSGPYALMKHPLYTGVALLVLPSVGFLLNTWLGLVLGVVMYAASRLYAPEEEAALSETFGAAWDEYAGRVKLPWL